MRVQIRFGGLMWLCCLASLVIFNGCASTGKSAPPPAKESAVPVVIAEVANRDLPVELRAIGTVEAYSTVAVRSQINGEIVRCYFQEGDDVKQGDLLFTIDSRPYESELQKAEANLARDNAQLEQAKANLARDQAQSQHAETELKRYRQLAQQGDVSQEQFEQIRTNAEALAASLRADQAAINNVEAGLRADQANIENAKVQLSYCSIKAPLSGRTGNLIVHQGNIVKANDTTPLVNINQVDPILVSFSVPEQELANIKKYQAAGKLQIAAMLPNDEANPNPGTLSFINNSVDRNTGTIQLKGQFENHQRRLWPGQFINTRMTLTTQPNSLVVPSQAIQNGQNGQFVFVVKSDQTVEVRPVKVSKSDDREAVIESGLTAGEQVVVDGQLRLTPGIKVEQKPTDQKPAQNK